MSSIRADLERLAQRLPDPFRMKEESAAFFKDPRAERLTAEGGKSSRELLEFLETNADPPLTRVAVLLLSRLDPALYYPALLDRLVRSDPPNVQAYEPGLWAIDLPHARIADDLTKHASADAPSPLLLLQHPAARYVKTRLEDFVKQDRSPLSQYALYAYQYALDSADVRFLREVSSHSSISELRSLANEYLNKLASPSTPP